MPGLIKICITYIRSMNQDKLKGVKQDIVRETIDILEISEQKWTGMGEFHSDDCYIYYCGQESLRKNWVALIVNKSPEWSTWMQSQKWQNNLCSFPRKPFNNTVIHVYAPNTNAKEAEVEWFYEDLKDLLELTTTTTTKSSQSRDTWSNKQLWPLSTKWNRVNPKRVLPRECTGHSKHPLPTTQEMTLCWGPAPADPGYSKERQHRRGSGNNCLIKR